MSYSSVKIDRSQLCVSDPYFLKPNCITVPVHLDTHRINLLISRCYLISGGRCFFSTHIRQLFKELFLLIGKFLR